MDRRKLLATIGAGAGLAFGLGACRGDSSYSLIGTTLPEIKGSFVDGSGFDLATVKKPAIIRFWGLWCGPCMIDMPNWFDAVRQLRASGSPLSDLNILTIHVGKAPENGPTLAQWTQDQPADAATPVVDDATHAIMKATGVTGTPSTIYVDASGRILEHAWQFKNDRGVASFLRKVGELHAKAAR